MSETKELKHWVSAKWCVIQNLQNTKINVSSGSRGFYKHKFKILFESDDMKECEAFKNNYNDDEEEQLVGYICKQCGREQNDPAACEQCYSQSMEPIWQ